jgi:hypothetical protein
VNDSPAPDQVAAYLTRVRALNELWSYATKDNIYRLLAAIERALKLAAEWDADAAAGTPFQDREQAARSLRRSIAAELLAKADGIRPCLHADEDGWGSHMLKAGETCPLAEPRDTDG